MKFYPADWQADELLGMCTLAARGLWIEMIGIMHKADPYGHLVVNGRPPTDTQLAALARCPPDQIPSLLDELENAGVFSRTRTRVIYSRRMTRDERRSKSGRNAQITGAKTGDKSEIIGTKPPRSRVAQAFDKTVQKTASYRVRDQSPIGVPSPQRPEARGQRRETERIESNPIPLSNGRAQARAVRDSEFAEFWQAYPRRDDRGHAIRAYRSARKQADQATLVRAASRYAEARNGHDPKFTALAATWLNGERWLDEAQRDGGPSSFTIGVG